MTVEEAYERLCGGGSLTRSEQIDLVSNMMLHNNGNFSERHQNVPAEVILYRGGQAIERKMTEVQYDGHFNRYRADLPLDFGRKKHAVLFIDGCVEIKAPPKRRE